MPFLTPGTLPDPGINSVSLMSPVLVDGFLPLVPPEESQTNLLLPKSCWGARIPVWCIVEPVGLGRL